jgi:hypothetical protein
MTELLTFIQMWWQELLFSVSILMFIAGVSIKLSEGSNETVKISKNEWLKGRVSIQTYSQKW